MDILEAEVESLKRQYPRKYHAVIDKNLMWVKREMEAAPSSISIHEGIIALSQGLPSKSPGRGKSAPGKKKWRSDKPGGRK